MMGTLSNVEQLATSIPTGSIEYADATYLDDNGIQQTGISLTAIGWWLSCFNGIWSILDNGGNPHIVQGGSVTCKITTITPDKDPIGNQLGTGTLTYDSLARNPPFIKFPSQPLVAWVQPRNAWGWVKPFSGGG